jgi:hypothetical protein
MKNLLLIPVLVFVLTSVNASIIPTISTSTNKTFVLNVNDWNTDELTISILSEYGEKLYSEVINPGITSKRKYSFEKLLSGIYKVEVSSINKSISYDVVLSKKSGLVVSEGSVSFSPYVSIDDKRVDLNILPLGKKVNISIYNDNGDKLYSETIMDAKSISKRLNIAQLPKGDYMLNMTVGQNNFTERIRK